MSWLTRVGPFLLPLLLLTPLRAEDAQPGERIAWCEDLATGFAQAKEEQKPLMICVNARYVRGRKEEEPAAKWLRDVIYKDVRVVGKSRELVCVLLTSEGSAADYGELRTLGIDGDLISPQHIFVRPDGLKILLRTEYWTYGQGESAIQAFLDMMEKALGRWKGESAEAAPGAESEDAAPEGEERVAWIAERVEQVVRGGEGPRKKALDGLLRNDDAGDCTAPLIALLPEHKKNVPLLVAVIRALGRDGLASAAEPIAALLGHRDEAVRGNAAVSLEYIGVGAKAVVQALRKAADREKDAAIANHLYRALGRCGVQDAKIRALLLKKTEGAKSEFASYGPAIGLAYFEGDAKAARGVEKMLKKIGVPGSRRGGGQNSVKRGVLSWTLAEIGDEKSGKFVREELIAKLEHVQAFWVGGMVAFWDGVARKCEGEDAAMAGIAAGVRVIAQYAKQFDLGGYGAERGTLMDAYRTDRDTTTFRPKGDNLLDADGGG